MFEKYNRPRVTDKRWREFESVKIVIALFGVLICLAGLVLLIIPVKFRNVMSSWTGQPRFLFAVIARIIIGAILLLEAPNLKFTFAMQIIGGISILAAVVLLLMGEQRMDRVIDWCMRLSDEIFRGTSIISIAFGAFLVYVTF